MFGLTVLSTLVLALPCQSDIVHLKDGRKIKGKVVNRDKQASYLRTSSGILSVATDSITQIVPEHHPQEIERNAAHLYREMKGQLAPSDLEGHYDLALFCIEHELFPQAIEQAQQLLSNPQLSVASKGQLMKFLIKAKENAAILLYNQAVHSLDTAGNPYKALQLITRLQEEYPETRAAIKAPRLRNQAQKAYDQELFIEECEKNYASSLSSHFVVFSPSKALSQHTAQVLEDLRADLLTRLTGSRTYPWNSKCRVYLFPNKDDFQRASQQEHWVAGSASIKAIAMDTHGNPIVERRILVHAGQQSLEQVVLPHELTHLVLRELVGIDKTIPEWLNEGFALYQQALLPNKLTSTIHDALERGTYIRFELLMTSNGYTLSPLLFYAESHSVVTFLINTFGQEKFFQLVFQSSSADQPIEEIVLAVYGVEIGELEEQWKEYALTHTVRQSETRNLQ